MRKSQERQLPVRKRYQERVTGGAYVVAEARYSEVVASMILENEVIKTIFFEIEKLERQRIMYRNSQAEITQLSMVMLDYCTKLGVGLSNPKIEEKHYDDDEENIPRPQIDSWARKRVRIFTEFKEILFLQEEEEIKDRFLPKIHIPNPLVDSKKKNKPSKSADTRIFKDAIPLIIRNSRHSSQHKSLVEGAKKKVQMRKDLLNMTSTWRRQQQKEEIRSTKLTPVELRKLKDNQIPHTTDFFGGPILITRVGSTRDSLTNEKRFYSIDDHHNRDYSNKSKKSLSNVMKERLNKILQKGSKSLLSKSINRENEEFYSDGDSLIEKIQKRFTENKKMNDLKFLGDKINSDLRGFLLLIKPNDSQLLNAKKAYYSSMEFLKKNSAAEELDELIDEMGLLQSLIKPAIQGLNINVQNYRPETETELPSSRSFRKTSSIPPSPFPLPSTSSSGVKDFKFPLNSLIAPKRDIKKTKASKLRVRNRRHKPSLSNLSLQTPN